MISTTPQLKKRERKTLFVLSVSQSNMFAGNKTYNKKANQPESPNCTRWGKSVSFPYPKNRRTTKNIITDHT